MTLSLLPGFLARNWQLKLSAFAMAVLLWTVPRFEGQSSRELQDIPVRIQLNDPEWDLVQDPSPDVVTVTLSGPARELMALGVDRPPVLIPIDEVTSGDTTVLLRTSWFRGAARTGVLVEDLRPAAVSLVFEKIEQRPIPLSISLTGELPQGVSMAGRPQVDPEVVVVFGTPSRFEGLDSLPLLPIDLGLAGAEGPLAATVDTTGLHDDLSVMSLQASVTIPIETTTARELTDQVLSLPVLESDPQLQARPERVTVVLVGARSLVEAVDPGTLRVTVPRSQTSLSPGQEERVLVVVEGVPELVEARVTPNWVTLRRPVGR
jgi:YbbR domain-containing protein